MFSSTRSYSDVIYIREKSLRNINICILKHDFRMSVMVHSSVFWLLHAFSSFFFVCTSIWVSLS